MNKLVKRLIAVATGATLVISMSVPVFGTEVELMSLEKVEISTNNFPDKAFRDAVSEEFDADENGFLSDAEIKDAEEIHMTDQGIKNVKGIELLTELEEISLSGNAITSIDLSGNDRLKVIDINNTKVTSLDLSQNKYIKNVECTEGPLASINLSGCKYLKDIDVSGTKLTSLDLSSCPAVITVAAEECALTSCKLSGLKKLETLELAANKLSSLDLSGCNDLSYLDCSENNLTNLNISGCTSLENVAASDNSIKELDLRDCSELESVDAYENDDIILRLPEGCTLTEDDVFADGTVYVGDKISFVLSGGYIDDISNKAYTGSQICPKPELWLNDKELVEGTDYVIEYGDNLEIGPATAKIVFQGDYVGEQTKEFKIVPKKTAISKITTAKKAMTVYIKYPVSATYGTTYQIAYKKPGAAWKYATTTAKSKKITGLTKGKKYTVEVRAYKKVGDTTYYGAWTPAKVSGKIK